MAQLLETLVPTLKGQFAELGLPEIFDYLRTTSKTGVLVLRNGNQTKSIFFKDGLINFATSNQTQDRLGEFFLATARITPEDFDEASLKLKDGKRLGKILIEMGCIGPKELWDGVREQVKQIVMSVFQWESGSFQFLEGEAKSEENITCKITVPELILESLRGVNNKSLFAKKIPSRDIIFERIMPVNRPEGLRFEEYEKHVFKLTDGDRTVQDVCDLSEIGEFETLKTLYIFFAIGFLHVKKHKDLFAEEQKEISDVTKVIKEYNEVFSFLFHYLLKEVGPIAENILEKYLGKLKVDHPEIFSKVTLRSNGTLSQERLIDNVKKIKNRRDALIDCLNEYLYAIFLAIKRTLGAEHEKTIFKTLRATKPGFFPSK